MAPRSLLIKFPILRLGCDTFLNALSDEYSRSDYAAPEVVGPCCGSSALECASPSSIAKDGLVQVSAGKLVAKLPIYN